MQHPRVHCGVDGGKTVLAVCSNMKGLLPSEDQLDALIAAVRDVAFLGEDKKPEWFYYPRY